MLSIKQNLRETIHGGAPDRYVDQYEYLAMVPDPVIMQSGRPKNDGVPVVNAWGITHAWPPGTPGIFPVHTPDKIVIKDITHWKDYVKRPPIKMPDSAWEMTYSVAEKINRDEVFLSGMVFPGLFEQTHHHCEIQRALIYLYEEPDDVKDFIKFLRDWELEYAQELVDHLHPDALFHHDDWGTQRSTFMSPDMFAEVYQDAYKEIYGFYHSHGVELIVHHSDSYAATLVPNMIDMGIDIFQGALTTNNIPELIKKYGGKISFHGGIDNGLVDRSDWTEENVERYTEQIIHACGKHYFIPGLTAGGPGSTYPGVYAATSKIIKKLSAEDFK